MLLGQSKSIIASENIPRAHPAGSGKTNSFFYIKKNKILWRILNILFHGGVCVVSELN